MSGFGDISSFEQLGFLIGIFVSSATPCLIVLPPPGCDPYSLVTRLNLAPHADRSRRYAADASGRLLCAVGPMLTSGDLRGGTHR